jgi:hypothetical protein
MFVSYFYMLSCVGRGICDGLITRPEEYYRVPNYLCIRNLNIRLKYGLYVVPQGKSFV